MTQKDLEREVRRIYKEVNRYADDVGGVDDGLTILFSPPMLNPKLMIISMQGDAGRNNRQRCWPSQMVYAKSPFAFGQRMTSDFDSASLGRVFRTQTVVTTLAFPESPRWDKWKKDNAAWLSKSKAWVKEFIELMRPLIILTYGKPPFEELTGERKHRGHIAEADYLDIPVIGCGYLMQGATKNERQSTVERVKALMNLGRHCQRK